MPDKKNPEIDPIPSLLAEFSDPEMEEEEFRNDFFQGLSGRRKKAAFALTLIWGVNIGLHLFPWNFSLIIFLGLLIFVEMVRLIFSTSKNANLPEFEQMDSLPFVSLLVSAKNEEAVIKKLVKMLLNIDYPSHLYELWIVNDNSGDRTGKILDELTQEYSQLNVIHRDGLAKGGKSGALNFAFSKCKGEVIGVFDADALIPENLLQKVVPLFVRENIGAVQVRKAISNPAENFWTRGQWVEMSLDSYFQRQRINCGGIGELRGNGQFVRRDALNSCGGWNEETITDDLDLTIRLHLDHWDIDILEHPAGG